MMVPRICITLTTSELELPQPQHNSNSITLLTNANFSINSNKLLPSLTYSSAATATVVSRSSSLSAANPPQSKSTLSSLSVTSSSNSNPKMPALLPTCSSRLGLVSSQLSPLAMLLPASTSTSRSRSRSVSADRHLTVVPKLMKKSDSTSSTAINKSSTPWPAPRKNVIVPGSSVENKRVPPHSPAASRQPNMFSFPSNSATCSENSRKRSSSAKNDETRQTIKYQRNLKKFHYWCKHCRRLKAAADSSTRGPTATSHNPSKNNHPQPGRRRAPAFTSSAIGNSKTDQSRIASSSFTSSDLPLKRPSFHLDPNSVRIPTSADVKKDQRPKSARMPLKSPTELEMTQKPKSCSLFNFDDALSLIPDSQSLDLNWMADPWASDDEDFSYNIDVDTMSICSDTSIIPLPITCDSKLKEDDMLFSVGKPTLRKSVSSQ